MAYAMILESLCFVQNLAKIVLETISAILMNITIFVRLWNMKHLEEHVQTMN